MPIFEYGLTEICHLKQRDKELGAVIDRIGMIEREITPDPFALLVLTIISQQISNRAAQTVRERLQKRLVEITPDTISNTDFDDIQGCGMSIRKATCIKGIADAVLLGKIDMNRLAELPNDEVIQQLSSLHGVGVWTSEMILIFSLCRQDIVSWGDLGIRSGMMMLYGLDTLTRDDFDRYCSRYSPYGSIASFYLWALSAK